MFNFIFRSHSISDDARPFIYLFLSKLRVEQNLSFVLPLHTSFAFCSKNVLILLFISSFHADLFSTF